jgi:hypothetical protein
MELRCVVAVIRHGDRTPKQKMKLEVKHQKFFDIFGKYDGYKKSNIKLKKPKQLQVSSFTGGEGGMEYNVGPPRKFSKNLKIKKL